MEVLLWTSVGGGFGPLFKHLLRDSGSGKLSLSVVLPWVCWEQKCPGAQPHIVWLLCSWGPQGKLPAQLTHCKHLENAIDELAEVWDGWDNNLFIGGRLLGCYGQPCCNSFGLSNFDGCCVPVTGCCYTLRNTSLWNYWVTEWAFVLSPTRLWMLCCELGSWNPSVHPQPLRAVTLTVACVVHSGAKQGLNSAPVTSSGSWGCLPPSSGCSVESLSSPKSLSCIHCQLEQPCCSSVSHQLSSSQLTKCCLCCWCLLISPCEWMFGLCGPHCAVGNG